MDEITINLAANLRKIRSQEKISLDEMSDRTGVSKSMLRQIENGDSSPSISIVWKIANGLKKSFSSLIEAPVSEYETIDLPSITPMVECDGGYRLFSIFPFNSVTGFEFYYIEIDSMKRLESEGHNGDAQEYIFVTQGELELGIINEIKKVKKNEAIRFNATVSHVYQNSKKEMVKMIMIISYKSKT
jgi:transcriptional regulator with XRE-family HTH domain